MGRAGPEEAGRARAHASASLQQGQGAAHVPYSEAWSPSGHQMSSPKGRGSEGLRFSCSELGASCTVLGGLRKDSAANAAAASCAKTCAENGGARSENASFFPRLPV